MSMVSNCDNSWCTVAEERFLTLVQKDLANFSRRPLNRVLVFSPLPPRFRFLIHKVVENSPELKSCSIGAGDGRRTVVYFQDKHKKTRHSMNTAKGSEKLAECGVRGGGRGARGRGWRQRDSPRGSPTSSRRPAQVLYTPGAFRQRKNVDSQETKATTVLGTVINTLSESSNKSKPFNECSETSNTRQTQVEAKNSRDQLDCRSKSDNCEKSILRNNDFEDNINKLSLCSETSNSDETGLENREKNGNKICLETNITEERMNNCDVTVTYVTVNETQPKHIDSTSTNVNNCLSSGGGVEQMSNDSSSVDTLSTSSEVDMGITSECCTSQERVSIHSPKDATNVHVENQAELNRCQTAEKRIHTDIRMLDSNETNSTEPVFPESGNCALENTINERSHEAQLSTRKLHKAVDHSETNTEGVTAKEPSFHKDIEGNVFQRKLETSDGLTVCCEPKLSDDVEKQESGPVEVVMDAEDGKIEDSERVVNGESIAKVEGENKSKRQCKKAEKAKKKEEKMKKKQVKGKSEKSTKKCDSEDKTRAKGVEEEEKKEKRSKEVMKRVEQRNKKLENSSSSLVKKTESECKDALMTVTGADKNLNQDAENPERDGGMANVTKSAGEEEEDWETAWDDDGKCLDAKLLEELNKHIDARNIHVVEPQYDYLSFKPNDITLENGVYDHVVEIYDFSPEFKTHDLITALSNFQQQGFQIHWVDDSHALAVFSNHRTAQQAIEEFSNPMLKLRPLHEGTQMSKLKAKRNIDVLQPYKERPKTTKLVANNLVAGALGIKTKMSREERQLEREKIKAERERKRNKEKQKKDLWESDDLK